MDQTLTAKQEVRLCDDVENRKYASVPYFNHNEFQVTKCVNDLVN